MSKFELSLSKDYVPNWTVVDAVRELFQNALDQQTTVEDNEMFFDYDPTNETLQIGNKLSILSAKTLLLGSSTKRDDPNTIGQFGEGYKIATLVLTRLDKQVTFYNYGVKEVWKPRFVKSKRYEGAEILTFFIDKKYMWQRVPDNNLTITIENISPEEYEDIVESNLHCQDVGEAIETSVGRILLDPKYSRKVFVNGLYVCSYPEYTYGYDFKPSELKIDRDRKLADSFELRWLASRICAQIPYHDLVIELIQKNAADVAFIDSMRMYAGDKQKRENLSVIADKTYEKFKDEHGENAVPVTSQEEFESVKKQYKPVFVSSSYSSMIKQSDKYEAPKVKRQTSKDKLYEWLKNNKRNLTKRAATKLKSIIDELP